MKNKLLFVFAFVAIMTLHSYILNSITINQKIIAVEPQDKVSPVINLQRVAIKEVQEVPVEIEEILPEPPQPVVEEVIVPIIKERAIKKVKKKKIVKKLKRKKKKKKLVRKTSKAQRSSPQTKAIKNSYLSKVRKIIEQHKKYPRIAKRMKQEGVVKVKFTIGKNGKIRHIKLAQKCPYTKLNKAALQILHQIVSFGPIPKELNETYLSLTVPIKYKIIR